MGPVCVCPGGRSTLDEGHQCPHRRPSLRGVPLRPPEPGLGVFKAVLWGPQAPWTLPRGAWAGNAGADPVTAGLGSAQGRRPRGQDRGSDGWEPTLPASPGFWKVPRLCVLRRRGRGCACRLTRGAAAPTPCSLCPNCPPELRDAQVGACPRRCHAPGPPARRPRDSLAEAGRGAARACGVQAACSPAAPGRRVGVPREPGAPPSPAGRWSVVRGSTWGVHTGDTDAPRPSASPIEGPAGTWVDQVDERTRAPESTMTQRGGGRRWAGCGV